jgi:preprotein translocase subunit SecG
MDEAKMARVTAILFGLLTIALLGLNVLSNM